MIVFFCLITSQALIDCCRLVPSPALGLSTHGAASTHTSPTVTADEMRLHQHLDWLSAAGGLDAIDGPDGQQQPARADLRQCISVHAAATAPSQVGLNLQEAKDSAPKDTSVVCYMLNAAI